MKNESMKKRLSGSHQTPTILQRIARADRAAVQDCLDAYGSLIWAAAKKYTASLEEAEVVTEEIFLDIWKYAARFDLDKSSETDFITLLTLRQLIRRARKTKSFVASLNEVLVRF